MKQDLVSLLIKECCKGRKCENCGFRDKSFHCCLSDIIEIIKKNEKENENYEK